MAVGNGRASYVFIDARQIHSIKIMKTLEILIPTYRRPISASAAIDSILQCADQRFRVRCNSNGSEPLLEKYRELIPQVVFDSFELNLGPHRNFLHLLKSADAKFCMLLSDEDRLDPEYLPAFLDYLDEQSVDTHVISCSIFDEKHGNYYHKPNKKLAKYVFDKNAFASLDLLPSYVSGVVYSVSGFKSVRLDDIYVATLGNAYPHLDLAQTLLKSGAFRFYCPRLVIKGKEVRQGGDAFAHQSEDVKKTCGNLDLNPAVYGPYARARQFYYRERFYSQPENDLSWIALISAKLSLTGTFLSAVWRSPQVVTLPPHIQSWQEVERAYLDAVEACEFSRTLSSRVFRVLVKSPRFLQRPVNFLFLAFRGVMRKLCKRIFLK